MKIIFIISILSLSIIYPYTSISNGDINQDSDVNIIDIIQLVDIILFFEGELDELTFWSSDNNQDFNIDVEDIIILVSYILSNQADCNINSSACITDPTICCLDVVPHEIEWIDTTFIQYNGELNDISIVDSTNIQFVGSIDLVGDTRILNNLILYSENKFSINNIIFEPLYYPVALYSICYYSPTDVWVGSNWAASYNGDSWSQIYADQGWEEPIGWINEIYCNNPNDIYFIGSYSSISRFDGLSYQIFNSGRDVVLKDIAGRNNDIWVVGATADHMQSVILRYNNNTWEEYYYTTYISGVYVSTTESTIYGTIRSVCILDDKVYFCGSHGIWTEGSSNDDWISLNPDYFSDQQYQLNKIRGLSENDIYVVGDNGLLNHYNGISWENLSDSTCVNTDFTEVEISFEKVAVSGTNAYSWMHLPYIRIGSK